MNNTIPKIQNIQRELTELSTKKNFEQIKRVILSVVKLLDDSISEDDLNLFQLFTDSDGKIRANASWFYEDDVIADRKATYKVHSENKLSLDFKVYGINKVSKRVISWTTAVTPNFEDEDEKISGRFNVGIDFIVPKSKDRIIVVLTNNYVIRTLELRGELTATYQEILSKWYDLKDFSNKKAIHTALWESFDLQPLNKKFYLGISERFILLRQHLIKEDILDEKHASMFANRLIGRVIFCWFLDKKDIINPALKYFDSESFESDTKYYKDKLERLFFGVLNTPIEEREYKDELTPFLNGGLFEARKNDLYQDSKLSFPKNYFDDLFEFLSGYNFTTDESTSQFQQVAIDPEMLGRIFENLLAEIVEETGEQARKAKGAFYTPREIVDYMCRESLKEYLKTKLPEDEHRDQRLYQLIDAPDKDFQDQDHNWRRDWNPYKKSILEALDDLKVLDPACGSGAYPIGMLQLLVRIYERIEARFDPYKIKLQIIEKNIYGIDIEPMAIEISRLRTWLSIIVDEGSDSKKIKPLPNLEFKFVCANSLIDLDQSGQATLYGEDPELENKLRDLRDAYFNTESLNKKKKLKSDYEKLVSTGEGLFGSSEKSKQLKTYRPFDNESFASFFNPEFMFGVKSFGIVIGNPPYVSYGLRGGQKMSTEDKDFIKKNFPNSAEYKISLYALFMDRAIQLSDENGGIQTFIVPDSFLLGRYFSKIRNYILKSNEILKFLLFSYGVFDATVGFSVVYFFKKSKNITGKNNISVLLPKKADDLIQNKIESFGYPQNYFNNTKHNRFRLFFNQETKDLIEKIEANSFELGSQYTGRTGVRSKIGQKNIIFKEKKEETYQKGIISGGQIKKYKINYDGDYININKELLNGGGFDYKIMNNPKILIRQTGDSLIASIDNEHYYHLNNIHSFAPNEESSLPIEYILAIINSNLMDYYYQKTTLEVGRPMAQTDIETIESLPIKDTSAENKKEIKKLVNNLLEMKNNDTNTKEIEDSINNIIFDIYGITKDEKIIIKRDSK